MRHCYFLLQFYSVICRVATVLQARYTSPGFWLAGLRLFEDSERLVAGTKEKEHLKACIARVHEHMGEAENEGLDSASNNIGSGILLAYLLFCFFGSTLNR